MIVDKILAEKLEKADFGDLKDMLIKSVDTTLETWLLKYDLKQAPGIYEEGQDGAKIADLPAEDEVRELPKDKRVVRTKASGDRVYLLDEVKKTRQWVTNPDVLDGLGFTLNDVGEVEEDEMLKYQMGPALYRRVDEVA